MSQEVLTSDHTLPSINGKDAFRNYQEHLKTSTGFQSEQPSQRSPQRSWRTEESRSARIMPIYTELNNIQELLDEERGPKETFSQLFKDDFPVELPSTRGQPNTMAKSLYTQNDQRKWSTQSRPTAGNGFLTASASSQRKKKGFFTQSLQLNKSGDLRAGKTDKHSTKNIFSLSGTKMGVQGQSNSNFVQQQKAYLKNLKQDPLVMFHTKFDKSEPSSIMLSTSNVATSPQRLTGTLKYQKLQLTKHNESFRNYRGLPKSTSAKIKTVLFDGNNLDNFELMKKSPYLHNKFN